MTFGKICLAFAAVSSVVFLTSRANAAEITFQELPLPSGTPFIGQYASYGVKFDGFYFSNDAGILDDAHGIFAFSGKISSPASNPVSYINFLNPITNLSIDYGKIGKPAGGFVQIDGIDLLGNIIGLGSINGGSDVFITYNAGSLILKSLVFSAAESGDGYVSALRFDTVRSAVPEPSSWMLMIAGFGLVGITARTKRRTVRCGEIA